MFYKCIWTELAPQRVAYESFKEENINSSEKVWDIYYCCLKELSKPFAKIADFIKNSLVALFNIDQWS